MRLSASDARSGIRKITPEGTIFGVGDPNPSALAVDGAGTVYSVIGPDLYVRPAGAEPVKVFRPSDGIPVSRTALLTGVALDPAGNVLIADQNNRRVLRVDSERRVSVAVGSGSTIALDIPPKSLATDEQGNIYVSQIDRRIIRVSPEESDADRR